MDRHRLAELLLQIPPEATEIIIKGMESCEVFFTMPNGWHPKEAGLVNCTQAPYASPYSKKFGGKRWRIS